ncbi:MAG: thiaminase II [Chloroflexi bacterium]|nr:thiaminase II [Chloroflexota bacterium]
MSFTQAIRARANALQQAIFRHPFVVGIGDGSLDVERFKHFIRQDYVFLIEYSRTLALACAKAPDLESMARFAELLHATLTAEISLHRSYCSRFGISTADLEATQATPTTQAYTDFLVRAAYHGSFAELACVLLPCLWGYCEIGLALARQGKPAHQPLYGEWIDMYSSPEYQALADWLLKLVDRLAEQAGPAERERMEAAYVVGTRYEYAFWDMAWRQEAWQL